MPAALPTSASPDQRWAYAAWIVALVGTLASLFLSEAMDLRPCALCWYQRVCLFPLVLVIGAGIALRDPKLAGYALPLTAVGLAISGYHNLLQLGVIPETLAPCVEGESCSERQIAWLGFITIPLMAFGTFAVIGAALVQHHRVASRSVDAETSKTPGQERE